MPCFNRLSVCSFRWVRIALENPSFLIARHLVRATQSNSAASSEQFPIQMDREERARRSGEMDWVKIDRGDTGDCHRVTKVVLSLDITRSNFLGQSPGAA
jgi:hypothetical protein